MQKEGVVSRRRHPSDGKQQSSETLEGIRRTHVGMNVACEAAVVRASAGHALVCKMSGARTHALVMVRGHLGGTAAPTGGQSGLSNLALAGTASEGMAWRSSLTQDESVRGKPGVCVCVLPCCVRIPSMDVATSRQCCAAGGEGERSRWRERSVEEGAATDLGSSSLEITRIHSTCSSKTLSLVQWSSTFSLSIKINHPPTHHGSPRPRGPLPHPRPHLARPLLRSKVHRHDLPPAA